MRLVVGGGGCGEVGRGVCDSEVGRVHARVHAVCDAGRMMQGLLAVHHILFPKSKKQN